MNSYISAQLNTCIDNDSIFQLNPLALPFIPVSGRNSYLTSLYEPNSRYLHTYSKALDNDINNEIIECRENYIPDNTGTKSGYRASYLNVNAKSFTYTSRLNPHAVPFSPLTNTEVCEVEIDDSCTESPYTILRSLG